MAGTQAGEGWLYLATVIDLFNREVVGWSMAEHMRTELIGDALTMAHTHGRIESGALFHSDRGSQGGFNWSSQHHLFAASVGDRRVPRLGCASRGVYAVACSGRARRRRGRLGTSGRGRCPSGSTA